SVSDDKNFLMSSDEIIENNNEFKADGIWQIVPGYKGCRTEHYNFNAGLFRLKALKPFVKMIELKLVMPSKKNIVSDKRNVPLNNKFQDADSKIISAHTAFSNAESMALFLDSLRQLSGKKPVGIKVCIKDEKDKKEFHEICYAFRKTVIIPDYIVIEDNKWENDYLFNFSQTACMSLYEGLLFVSKTLEMYGLEKQVKIIAATSIYTAFDVLKLHALGADAIRMQNCTLADDDKENQPFEYTDNLRNKIIRNTTEIMKACGYTNFKDITLTSLLQRFDFLQYRGFSKIDDHKASIDIKRKPFHIQKIS
ncbi:MAG: glutamate synthase-related protein, partial [Parafilimonas sp.]